MLDFLKRFGLGILYVLISPFVLAFLICWAIVDLGIYFYEFFKALISFFKGKKMFPDFPEDVEAKRILTLEPFTDNQVNTTTPNDNQNTNNGGNPS